MCMRASNEELNLVIADNLRNERMKRNWSQQFVADQTGLSMRTVSRCENGKGMSCYTLKTLCRLYGLNPMDAYRTSSPDDAFGGNAISPTRIISVVANSRFIYDIQKEIVLSLSQEMKNESFISREQIKNLIYASTGKKNSYSLEDMVTCCREVNSLTTAQMMNAIRR